MSLMIVMMVMIVKDMASTTFQEEPGMWQKPSMEVTYPHMCNHFFKGKKGLSMWDIYLIIYSTMQLFSFFWLMLRQYFTYIFTLIL